MLVACTHMYHNFAVVEMSNCGYNRMVHFKLLMPSLNLFCVYIVDEVHIWLASNNIPSILANGNHYLCVYVLLISFSGLCLYMLASVPDIKSTVFIHTWGITGFLI